MPVSSAKKLDGFIVALNRAIQGAIADAGRADPALGQLLRYADTYGPAVPHNCKGTTPHASVTAAELSPSFRGISGSGLKNKFKLLLSSATFHPTKAGQKVFAAAVQAAFSTMSLTPVPYDFPITAGGTPPVTTTVRYTLDRPRVTLSGPGNGAVSGTMVISADRSISLVDDYLQSGLVFTYPSGGACVSGQFDSGLCRVPLTVTASNGAQTEVGPGASASYTFTGSVSWPVSANGHLGISQAAYPESGDGPGVALTAGG